MQLATIHEQAGNFPAARDAYEKLLAVSPGFVPALNNLAVLSSEHLGRLDVARDLARRAREAAPNEPAIADTLGWILYKHAEYGDARRLLREAAAGMPDNPEVQFHLGMVSYMMGDEAVARLALQKAVDAGGDAVQTAQARQRLALLAIDSATAAAPARAELGKFLREHPDDPAALLRLARLELRDGAADRAARTLEKVVAAHPLHAPAVRQLALLQGGRPIVDARAYELVEKARESYPDDPDLARTLGILSYRRDLYPRAVELLEQAVRVRKDDGELLLYLGAAHRQLRRWKECKGALERAIKSSLSAEQAASVREMLSECSESAAP